MMRKALSRGKIAIIVTLSLTLGFIFVQSSFPPSVSGAQIDAVGNTVGGIFSSDGAFGAFLQNNISNIAHFLEYGALGLQISVAVFLWFDNKLKFSLLSIASALGIAFLDESVQILSGRHASVADMWIDLLGFSVFYILTFSILIVFNKRKRQSGRG
jgi:VanZ family protein